MPTLNISVMYLAIFFNNNRLGDDPLFTRLSMYMLLLVISSLKASIQLLVSIESETINVKGFI